MNYNRRNSERTAPFARSRDWLLTLWMPQLEKNTTRVEALLTLLLGLWICKSASKDDTVPMQNLVKQLECKLNSEEFRQAFDPFRYDFKLLLLTYQILSQYNCCADWLESFLKQVAVEFSKLSEIPFNLIGEALLLSQLGFVEPPSVPPLTRQHICGDRVSPLRLDRSQLVLSCDSIANASHFGLRRLRTSAWVRLMLRETLPPLLLQSLRHYDLELGATILRTMRYAGLANDRVFQLGLLFLLDQQNEQGYFGRLSKEAVAITECGAVSPEDVTARLYLPITVCCLWALAECMRPNCIVFSLYTQGHTAQVTGATC